MARIYCRDSTIATETGFMHIFYFMKRRERGRGWPLSRLMGRVGQRRRSQSLKKLMLSSASAWPDGVGGARCSAKQTYKLGPGGLGTSAVVGAG